MQVPIKLPIGIEDFEKLRTEGFYYVDKTGLIKGLLDNWGEVNLFTRPRRFGKSLNMNMLRCFFGYGCDRSLFDGLAITEEKELCEKYMGRFPVMSLTLKDIGAMEFETAQAQLRLVVGEEALRFRFLLDSDKLSDEEKIQYRQLINVGAPGETGFDMTREVLETSLMTMCRLIQKHYGQKVILLIDEYDVPLDKAQHYQYYDEMVSLIRGFLGKALKGNEGLQFAVLTGCLRVAKESIFTGLNNLHVLSITDVLYDEYFGFSDREVRDMLAFYGFEDRYDLVKEWYDGYHFGNVDVYCPWDVINYCARLRAEPDARPRAFWINTSGNDIIRIFLQKAKARTRGEIERLINGACVEKKIRQELTYRDLYKDVDNIWSVLFTTGYLTQTGRPDGDVYQLVIPNLEIRQIFAEQILEWFEEDARRDGTRLEAFCGAFRRGDAAEIEERFNAYLLRSISVRDTGAGKGKKENFYHGILLGLLSYQEEWDVWSNAESGDGFSDILVEIEEERVGIVIEVKYVDSGDLETGCQKALEQIEEKEYDARLNLDGMETILKYGIGCRKKACKVRISDLAPVIGSGSQV